jgi:uncharacterized membrane protein
MLNFRQDVQSGFPFLEKSVNEHAVLVIAYLVMSVFAALIPGATMIASFIASVLLLILFCHVIRTVWQEIGEQKTDLSFRKQGTPLLSLVFLQVLYGIPTFLINFIRELLSEYMWGMAIFIILLPPVLWWMAKSSLAIVLVVIEEIGAIAALIRSHKLMDKPFWDCVKYLALVNLLVSVPALIIMFGLEACMNFMYTRAFSWPIMLGAKAIISLLKAVFWFISQMLLMNCLVRLYEDIRDNKQTKQEAQTASNTTLPQPDQITAHEIDVAENTTQSEQQ